MGGQTGTGTILDNDTPRVNAIDSVTVHEGENAIFTVTLDQATVQGTTLTLGLADGSATLGADYTGALVFSNGVINNGDGTITVPAGVGSFTVTVPTVNDTTAELTEDFTLSVGGQTGTGTILDNDVLLRPDSERANEDVLIHGNVLNNDNVPVALELASFTVGGVTHAANGVPVDVSVAGKVVGTLMMQTSGQYTFTPTKDWSGTVPTVTYTTDAGTSSTLSLAVTPVADVPLVSVTVHNAPELVHGSINRDNATDTGRGYTITATGTNGKPAAVSNVPTAGDDGKVSGFGVEGKASGDDKELGNKEKLVVKFDDPVTNVKVSMSWLAKGETAHYVLKDALGNIIGEGNIKGVSDVVDTPVALNGVYGHAIGSIEFTAVGKEDDYLIHEITYDVVRAAHTVDIVVTPQDVDYSEAVTKIVVQLSHGATLNVGVDLGGGRYELPLTNPVGYGVVLDAATGQLTLTGVQVIPAKGSNGDVSVTVEATVNDGPDSQAMGSGSAVFNTTDTSAVAPHEVHATQANETLLGTAQEDVFTWQNADKGTTSKPGQDTVTGFDKTRDKLDLSDLLKGEENTEDLSKFLHFDQSGNDTVVKISSTGNLSVNKNWQGQETSVKNFDQQITLKGVDLVGGGHNDQNQLIHDLIRQGKLGVDGHNY